MHLSLQVGPSSLLVDQQASLPESQEIHTNGDAAAEDSPLDADQSDSTDSEMENNGPAADGEDCMDVYVCVWARVLLTVGPLKLQSWGRVSCSVNTAGAEVMLRHFCAPNASAP